MRYLINKILFIVMFATIVLNSGCSKSDDTSPNTEERIRAKVAGTWMLNGAILDNNDITGDFSGFQIVINESLEFTTNSDQISRIPNPWPQTGSLEIEVNSTNTESFNLIRFDGLVMNMTLLSDGTEVRIVFTFDDSHQGSNRIQAVQGQWQFDLQKQ